MSRAKRMTAMLLCILTLLTMPAFAVNEVYSDVPVGSEYYDAVMWATEKGLVGGVGGGKFLPDAALTQGAMPLILFRQYMPERAFVGSDKNWEATAIGNAEWFGLYAETLSWEMKEQGLTWANVWEVIVDLAGLAPYPAWYYTDSEPALDFGADIAYYMSVSGLSDAAAADVPTRGAFIQLLYDVEHGNYTAQKGPEKFWGELSVVVEQVGKTWRVRNLAMRDWMLLDETVKQAYLDGGWSLLITQDMRDYYERHFVACGMTDSTCKRITLATNFNSYGTEVLVHEMGHYLYIESGANLIATYMFDTEKDAAAELLNKAYCRKDKHEMFAEVYRYVALNRHDEAKYAEMQEQIPLCPAYIERGYLDCDGLFDWDELNAVTYEYWARISAAA